MENRAKKELARKRFIIHSVLCALVPPIGMLLVWRNRYPNRTKLLMTLGSTLILAIMFSIGLRLQKPEEITATPMSATYANTETTETQQEQTMPAETPSPAEDSYVAPANPNG